MFSGLDISSPLLNVFPSPIFSFSFSIVFSAFWNSLYFSTLSNFTQLYFNALFSTPASSTTVGLTFTFSMLSFEPFSPFSVFSYVTFGPSLSIFIIYCLVDVFCPWALSIVVTVALYIPCSVNVISPSNSVFPSIFIFSPFSFSTFVCIAFYSTY